MAYFLFFVGWIVGGFLLARGFGYLMARARTKPEQPLVIVRGPTRVEGLRALVEKAQQEVDARHGIRR